MARKTRTNSGLSILLSLTCTGGSREFQVLILVRWLISYFNYFLKETQVVLELQLQLSLAITAISHDSHKVDHHVTRSNFMNFFVMVSTEDQFLLETRSKCRFQAKPS